MQFILATIALSILAMGSADAAIRLRNTYYYVVMESEYVSNPRDTEILNLDGEVLALVSAAFRKAVDIEGTGRLMDGRVINYAGRKEGRIRYFISLEHFGYGVGTCR